MAYTVINRSNETIRWTVRVRGEPVWTSDDLVPGEQRSAIDTTPGIAVEMSIEVPQYDSDGNPHGSLGWGGVFVQQEGCVTVHGNWNFDVRRRCDSDVVE
jgi:hypothetical protein